MVSYKFRVKHSKIQWYCKPSKDDKEQMIFSCDTPSQYATQTEVQAITERALAAGIHPVATEKFKTWFERRQAKREAQAEERSKQLHIDYEAKAPERFISAAEQLLKHGVDSLNTGQREVVLGNAKAILASLGESTEPPKLTRLEHAKKAIFG